MPLKVAPCALALTINHFIPDPSGKTQKNKKWTIGQKTRWKTAVNWMNNQMNNLSDKWTEDPIDNQMNNRTDSYPKKKLMKLFPY